LIRHAHKNNVTIATLNYDNSVELSAQRTNIKVDFGLDSFFKTNEIILCPKKLAFLKLHGSLDWRSDLRLEPSDDTPVHQLIVDQYIPEKDTVSDFAIIFGNRNKLRADGPFLKLFIEFEKHLSKAEMLTIIGYSFGDEHINSLICQWLNGGQSRRVRAISLKELTVNDLPFYTDEHAPFLAKRFEFIGGGAARAIAKLYH
jgi:hypothetical protein